METGTTPAPDPAEPQSMLDDSLFNEIGTTYASTGNGTAEEAINPATIGMIWTFIQSLLGGCKSADRAKMAMQRPILSGARRQVNNYLDAQSINLRFDRRRVRDTIEKLAQKAPVEKYKQVMESAERVDN